MNRLSDKMKYIAVSLILLAAAPLRAQTVTQWTLEECIRYAIEHNITLKQGEQTEEARRTDLNTSRHSWLPDLNAGVSQNFDFGRSPSKTGVIVDQNSANSSFSLQLNMPLFDGFRTANDIAARRLDLLAATENLNKAKEDLAVGVASYYLQVLYNKELLGIAELQASLTAEQVKKTEALVQAGKVPLSQLYDMKAQLARDEVSLVEARNNVSLALLDLAQSLELERSGDFDIPVPVVPDVVEAYMASIVPPDHIYDQAVTFKPQIKEQEYLLQSQQKTLKIAQSGYYPKLNLNASYSNGYYSYSGENAASNTPFGDQLRQNERKTIGLSLSIPIFNRFQVRNSVRSARINIRNRELMMENTKKALYKEIQQAYYSATASQESYIASGKSVAAGKEAFTYAEERYGNGKSTVFEYGEAKTKYARSLAEQTQAKYNFIFRAKILDFYKGMPIRL
ncbi:Outer membrane protein tolC precursor [Bacteroidales bacterium Barb6]|nr:Outer membrane protein tolC precursor [Bacteroidales bacterium Barb6]